MDGPDAGDQQHLYALQPIGEKALCKQLVTGNAAALKQSQHYPAGLGRTVAQLYAAFCGEPSVQRSPLAVPELGDGIRAYLTGDSAEETLSWPELDVHGVLGSIFGPN